MAHAFNKIRPLGGLDQDSEARSLESLDYVYGLNIRNAITAGGRGGTLTNILGNTEVTKYTMPYTGGTDLPAGDNICLGAFEDDKHKTIIYFVWNSEGNHSILRYYSTHTDPNNPYGDIEQVIGYDFGWSASTIITSASIVYGNDTSGDLLYWTQPEPRKINLDKANICRKQKTWEIVLPKGYAGQSFFFQAVVKNFATGASVASINITIAANLTIEEMLSSLTTQINAGLSVYVTATTCDCTATVEEDVINTYDFVLTDPAFFVIPLNWYGGSANLTDRYFDRCKWPSTVNPIPTYEVDANFNLNYVKNSVFQFCLRYVYDDYEYTTLGVYSQVPVNNLNCGGIANPNYNFISVNFNDTSLLSTQALVILKHVEVLVLEVGAVNWKKVVTLTPCEFLDYADSAVYAHYDFYNNTGGETIDSATQAKLYDNIPLESGTEIFTKNRIIDGDILEGYNPPDCIEADYQMEFVENPQPTGYDVTVNIKIFNHRLDNNQTTINRVTGPTGGEDRGGIFWKPDLFSDPDNAFPVYGGGIIFGGVSYITDNPGGAAIPPIEAAFDREQILPEGGFTGYLAGTQHFAISKQIQSASVSQTSTNAIDVSTVDGQTKANTYYQTIGNLMYSTLTIKNVPNGRYVFRLASPWVSFGDKLGKGDMYDLENGLLYQKTSAPIWGINNTYSGAGWMPITEIEFVVNNAGVFLGDFVVRDLVDYENVGGFDGYPLVVTGYVIDNDGNGDIDALQTGATIEKAYATQYGYASSPQVALGEDWTDHNGYFAVNSGLNATDRTIEIKQIGNGATTAIHAHAAKQYYTLQTEVSALQQLQDGTIAASYSGSAAWFELIVPCTNSSARNTVSTFIEGQVVDTNGNPQVGALVIYTSGRYTYTDSEGNYSILAWGDMRGNTLTGNLNSRTVDSIIVQNVGFCTATYSGGQIFSVTINPWVPNYTPTVVYTLADIVMDLSDTATGKSHKRGGNYLYGIRYYDAAGRLCSVSAAFEMYIPFINEDLGLFPAVKDFSDNPYAVGTYRYGIPSIKWSISSQPPEWAVTYQWMRTKNTIYARYLQWCANSVKYLSRVASGDLDELVTSYANGDAIALKISVENLVYYSAANPQSVVSYTYEAGDRVRLIASRDIEYYEGLFDFEVTSFETSTKSLIVQIPTLDFEIKSGMFFEVYNPKKLVDNEAQIYYEVGEVYKCTNPNQPNNAHSVTTALFSNGDTYWRGRFIPVFDDETNYGAICARLIESASVSDFYISNKGDEGRIGIVDLNFRQQRNPTLMRFSNQFLAVNNGINGLSSIEPENYLELDRAYGAIRALVFTQNTLVIIGANREVSQYLGQTTLQQGSSVNAGLVALSDSFFGAPYVHSRMLGTDNKATVIAYNGQIFALANYIGNVWRYQGDGEVSISDAKMNNYFQTLAESGVTKAVAVYDRFHEEYILTVTRIYSFTSAVSIVEETDDGYRILVHENDDGVLPLVGEVVAIEYEYEGTRIIVRGTVYSITFNEETGVYDIEIDTIGKVTTFTSVQVNVVHTIPETIAWFNGNDSVKGDKWASFRSYTPEAYGTLNSGIYSFKEARLWKHDTNYTYNNFYGEQYTSVVTPVFNDQPDWMKVWNACILMTLQDDNANNWEAPNIYNNNGQQSRLKEGSWIKRGEHWYTPFKRDLNDLTVATNLRISQGRALRSTSLTCELVNAYTGGWRLYGWDANWTPSERTTK